MHTTSQSKMRLYPVGVWLVILGLIFGTEYGVMLLLPSIVQERSARMVESTVDSIALTVIVAPALWWLIVRPLQLALSLQARFLADSLRRVELERRHLARELHDGVGQSMTLLVSGLRSLREGLGAAEVCRRSHELHQLAQTVLKDIKKLSLGLRPSLLDDLGLAPAIERVVNDIRQTQPLEVTVDLEAIAGRRLPECVETALFRIFQESMNNAVKHAAAHRVWVQIQRDKGTIALRVRDDGRGIPTATLTDRPPPNGHLGLVGMHERAALLGGKLSINAVPGGGTCVVAQIPEKGNP
jgi:signal transduction histidine kinase